MKSCAFRGCDSWGPLYRVRLKDPKTGRADFNTIEVCNSHREEARKAGILGDLEALPAPEIVEVGDRVRPGLGRLWEGESTKQKGGDMPVCSVCKKVNGKRGVDGKVVCKECQVALKPVPERAAPEPAVVLEVEPVVLEVEPAALEAASAELELQLEVERLLMEVADRQAAIDALKGQLDLANRDNRCLGNHIDQIDKIIGFDAEEGTDEDRLAVVLAMRNELEQLRGQSAELERLRGQSAELEAEERGVRVVRLTREDLARRVLELQVVDAAWEQLASATVLPIGGVAVPMDEEIRIFLGCRLAERQAEALTVVDHG